MLEFEDVHLESMVIHKVGNPTHEEELELSNMPVDLSDESMMELLKFYFLKPFKNQPYHHFHHESSLDLNEVYHFTHLIFQDQEALYAQSISIAKHLYEQSTHPNIKAGEFYVCFFENLKLDGDYVDAVGLFKSENKERFLTVYPDPNGFGVDAKEGININKLDKGCLILNVEKEDGYRVCMVDTTNKGSDVANYWRKDFLNLRPREDSHFHTNTYLDIAKSFCEEVFTPENDVAKQDQLLLMDRSINYFQKHDEFNVREFEQEVIKDPGVIEAFNDHKEQFVEENDVTTFDEFDISSNAVKGQKKFFKSVLKLDKKFHVYVHGGHDFMESGFDPEKQMRYYKLFFHKES